MPAREVVLQNADETFLGVVQFIGTVETVGHDNEQNGEKAHPKMRSGCDIKSVIRSNMLRGSSTNVGKVTLDRSIPTLCTVSISAQSATLA